MNYKIAFVFVFLMASSRGYGGYGRADYIGVARNMRQAAQATTAYIDDSTGGCHGYNCFFYSSLGQASGDAAPVSAVAAAANTRGSGYITQSYTYENGGGGRAVLHSMGSAFPSMFSWGKQPNYYSDY